MDTTPITTIYILRVLHFITSFFLLKTGFKHAGKLHSAFLCLAVIYTCDFTAAKKSRNVAKLLRINSF